MRPLLVLFVILALVFWGAAHLGPLPLGTALALCLTGYALCFEESEAQLKRLDKRIEALEERARRLL